MTALYIYSGPHADAAHHLVTRSALASVTVLDDVWYAGAECTRVELTTPRPSQGERVLWAAAESFATEHGGVDVAAAREWLDPENLAVLAEACAMAFGAREQAEVGVSGVAADAAVVSA